MIMVVALMDYCIELEKRLLQDAYWSNRISVNENMIMLRLPEQHNKTYVIPAFDYLAEGNEAEPKNIEFALLLEEDTVTAEGNTLVFCNGFGEPLLDRTVDEHGRLWHKFLASDFTGIEVDEKNNVNIRVYSLKAENKGCWQVAIHHVWQGSLDNLYNSRHYSHFFNQAERARNLLHKES